MNTGFQEMFEQKINTLLGDYLRQKKEVDEILPDTYDLEERWPGVLEAYLPDGVREYADYPTVSLGWMMFIGMALAKWWDEDWEMYSEFKDFYAILRDGRGYDNLDEYVCRDILKLTPEEEKKVSDLVANTAKIAYQALNREGFEPGTSDAFNAYVRCLHQLYYFGAAVELYRLGYRMKPL